MASLSKKFKEKLFGKRLLAKSYSGESRQRIPMEATWWSAMRYPPLGSPGLLRMIKFFNFSLKKREQIKSQHKLRKGKQRRFAEQLNCGNLSQL